jgi:hypothetical protein
MSDINKYAKENVLKFLIGNKSDLVNDIKVLYEEARALASQMNTTYFSLSAKKNENINEFFETATRLFLIKYNFFEKENKNVILNKKDIKDNKKKISMNLNILKPKIFMENNKNNLRTNKYSSSIIKTYNNININTKPKKIS